MTQIKLYGTENKLYLTEHKPYYQKDSEGRLKVIKAEHCQLFLENNNVLRYLVNKRNGKKRMYYIHCLSYKKNNLRPSLATLGSNI